MGNSYQKFSIFGGLLNLQLNKASGIIEAILLIAILIVGLFVAYLVWNTVGLGALLILLIAAGILLAGVLLYLISR